MPTAPKAPRNRETLEQGLSGRDNAFGLLRLVLAGLVLLDHSFPLGGFGDCPVSAWTSGQDTLGGFAVGGFFLLSGYLVTKSAQVNEPLQFLWRRSLRIFPAYWATLVATAFVLGPVVGLAEKGTLSGYVQGLSEGPLGYVLGNLTLAVNRWGIYDLLLDTTPYGRAQHGSVFNGSIWTLAYEWRCYLLVLLLAVATLLRRAPLLVPLAALGLHALLLLQKAGLAGLALAPPFLRDGYDVELTWLFLLGGALALYARKVPLDDRLGVLSLVVVAVTLRLGGWFVIGFPALGYGLLWMAARVPGPLRRVGQVNDVSYGVYLWAFPVQQVAALAGVPRFGWAAYVAVSALGTGAAAWLSWRLVERPALGLKDVGPGRSWGHWRKALGWA